MTRRAAQVLTTPPTFRLLGLIALILFAAASAGFAGDTRQRAARSHEDFGPAPDDVLTDFDAGPLPRQRERRPLDRDEIRSRERDPAPAFPPQPKADEPSLDEKITRRYQDPRVIRILTELTSQSGEAFFREISQMVDRRHIEPTPYARRIDTALVHLQLAAANPAFQTATGIRPAPGNVGAFQQQLTAMQADLRVRNQAEAVTVMRQVGRAAQQSLGLNPGAVCLEFVYASLDTLDKFSMLLPPEKTGQVSLGLNENLVGIGVEVEPDPAGLRIVKAFPGGPAAEATLRKGDLITAVNGRSITGAEMSQAVDLITGRAGTAVKLSLRREQLVAELTLVRRQVEVSSLSEVRMLEESSRVGYIRLDQFAESSAKELDAAMWKLHNAGMESLVLDLRGNPGGYLTSAIEISDRFLPAGTIVSTRGRTSDDNSEEAATYPNTWKIPLVVLIDHQSASASEIFAAAIQENNRGVIVGEKSYGKGTVQTLFPLRSLTAGLRLTTAKFYSPDGREMAGEGVTPDINVRTGSGDDDVAMLQAALEAARDPRLQSKVELPARTKRSGVRVMRAMTAGLDRAR